MTDGGPSFLGIRCRRLALIELVESTISLALLALLASATVASQVGVRQRCQPRLSADTDRLVGAARRRLVEVDTRTAGARGPLLVDICYVNCKLVRQIRESTRLLLLYLINILNV